MRNIDYENSFEKQLLDQLNIAVIGFNADFEVVYVNKILTDLTGLSIHELSQFTISGLLQAKSTRNIEKLNSGYGFSEVSGIDLPGLDMYYEISVKPITKEGNLSGLYLTFDPKKAFGSEGQPFIESHTAAFANVSDPVLITDAGGNRNNIPEILYANPAFKEMTGYSQNQLTGKELTDLIDVRPDKLHSEELKKTIQEKAICQIEKLCLQCNDQTNVVVDWLVQPLEKNKDDIEYFLIIQQGAEMGYTGMSSNKDKHLTSDSADSQNMGSERELQFESDPVFKNAPEMMASIYGDYFISINNFWTETLGWSIAELKSHPVTRFSHPDEKQRLKSMLTQLEGGHCIGSYVGRFMEKSGAYRWLSWNGIKDENSGAICVFIRDITETRFLEEKMQESENKFRTLSEKSLVCVYMFSQEKFEYVNPKLADLSGYNIRELYESVAPLELVHPEDRHLFEERVSSRLEGGKNSEHYEFRMITRAGEVKYVEVYGTVVVLEGRKLIMGTLVDTTENKKVEQELRANQYFIQKVIDNTPGLIQVYDYQKLEYVYLSHSFENILGYTIDEIKGMKKGIGNLIHPDDSDKVLAAFYQNLNLKDREVNEVRFRIQNKKGEWRWLLSRDTPFNRDDQGNVKQILSSVQDITERKQQQQEVLENQQFIESVARHTPHIINIYDREQDKIIYQNRDIIDMIGYQREEIRAMENGIWDLYHPEDKKKVKEYYKKSYLAYNIEKEEVQTIQFRLKHKKGHWVWFFNKDIIFKRDDQGKVKQYLGVIQDITGQRAKEEELIENQQFIESVARNTPNIINIFDIEIKKLIFTNRTMVSFLGYSDEESHKITKEEYYNLYHQEDLKRIEAYKKQVINLKDDEEAEIEFRMKHKNGGWVWFLNKDVVFKRDESGKIKQMLGVVQDITDNKKKEEEIIEKQQFIESVAKHTPHIINIYDIESGSVVFQNRQLIHQLGYSEEDIKELNNEYARLYHPDDLTEIKKYKTESLKIKDDDINEIEFRVKHKDGHWVWLLNKDVVFKRNEKGEIKQFLGVIQDVTEQKEAWQALEKSEILFRQLFDNAPVGIVMLNKKGSIINFNEGFCEIFRYSKEDIGKDKKLNQLITPRESHAESDEIIKKTIKGESVYRESLRVDKHGNSVPVLIYGVPIFFEGEAISMFGIYVDISDRKKAEEDLKKQTQMLLRSNAELEQFAYVTSHNLRSPVINIQSLIEFFDSSELKDENNRYVFEKIHQSVNQLGDTLSDLIEIVTKKNQLSQPKERIKFREIFNKVLNYLSNTIREKGVTIEADFEVTDIYYLRSFMESIFHNLLTNAIKYSSSDRKPHIHISAKHAEGYVCLKVADNGLGINLAKYGHRLFNLYQQFHIHREGKGMGLYMVKTQVESLEGRVEVESQEGIGTTFYIYLKDFKE